MKPTKTPEPNGSTGLGRRDFLKGAALSAVAFSMPDIPSYLKEANMGVVVHSYWTRWGSKVPSSAYPGFTNALDLIEHCRRIGAGGVQVGVKDWSTDFAKKVRDQREKAGLYLEGSIGLPKTAAEVGTFEQEVKNAREAGATVLRTVCSGGRRYETFKTKAEFQQFQKNALASLQLAEPVLRKHKVKLGIENHKDYRADELAAVLKGLQSEWIGVTLDFGNSMALLEDPMEVVHTLVPYLVSTHVKDMGVQEYADGFLLSEVPLGQGILDLKSIVAICRKQNPNVTFSLEMITRDPLEIPCLKPEYWATFDEVPGRELARMLRMVREHPYPGELPRTSPLSAEEKLAAEERNIVDCLSYSKEKLKIG
jgi:3-oxoisoapionate decarboxylase